MLKLYTKKKLKIKQLISKKLFKDMLNSKKVNNQKSPNYLEMVHNFESKIKKN
jgi:hypothetical protein